MPAAMPDPGNAVHEILAAAEQFLDEGEYERVVIQANRLLTLSSLWFRRPMAATVAVGLRIASQDLAVASAPDGKLNVDQKRLFERLLSGYGDCLQSEPSNMSLPWTHLKAFKSDFWEKIRGEVEGRSYSANEPVIEEALKWAKSALQSNSALIRGGKGSPFIGAANEIEWVTRTFSASARQLASFATLSALAWESEFLKWAPTRETAGLPQSPALPEFDALLVRALDVVYPATGKWDEIAEVLTDLGKMWRSDFSIFFDLFLHQQERIQRSGVPQGEEGQKADRRGFRKPRGS